MIKSHEPSCMAFKCLALRVWGWFSAFFQIACLLLGWAFQHSWACVKGSVVPEESGAGDCHTRDVIVSAPAISSASQNGEKNCSRTRHIWILRSCLFTSLKHQDLQRCSLVCPLPFALEHGFRLIINPHTTSIKPWVPFHVYFFQWMSTMEVMIQRVWLSV